MLALNQLALKDALEYGVRQAIRADALALTGDIANCLFAYRQALNALRPFISHDTRATQCFFVQGHALHPRRRFSRIAASEALEDASKGNICESDPRFPVSRTVLNRVGLPIRRELVVGAATSIQQLAEALFRRGYNDHGEAVITELLDSLEESKLVLAPATEQEGLADALARCRDLDLAERLLRRIGNALENNRMRVHRADAMVARALGEVLSNRGDHAAAGPMFACAEKYLRAVAGNDGDRDDSGRRD